VAGRGKKKTGERGRGRVTDWVLGKRGDREEVRMKDLAGWVFKIREGARAGGLTEGC